MTLLQLPRTILDRVVWLLAPIAPLVARLVVGFAFTQTGLGKWRHMENTTQFFTDLGIPFPHANAIFVATLELVGGWALIFGIGTRIFSLLLSATLVVALMTADRENLLAVFQGTSEGGIFDVTPIPFLVPLLLLAAYGSGAIGLDRLLSQRVGSSRRPAGAA